jgi:hypothetical protein
MQRCTHTDHTGRCTTLVPHGRCPAHQAHNRTSSRAWRQGSTRRWRTLRAQHLNQHPHCQRCGAPGQEVDHIHPLEQDGARYDPANLQTLCVPCHRAKTKQERRMTATTNQPIRVDTRVTVVIGPPCSGKTTYVTEHRGPEDLVVDLDVIAQALGSPRDYGHPPHLVPFMCEARDAVLRRLGRKHGAPRVWVVTTRPEVADQLVGSRRVTIDADRIDCKSRAHLAGRPPEWLDVIDAWFDRHG